MSANPEHALNNSDSHAMFGLALFWERNNVCVTNNGNLVARDENAPHACETESSIDELRKRWDEQRAQRANEDEQFAKGHSRAADGAVIQQISFGERCTVGHLKRLLRNALIVFQPLIVGVPCQNTKEERL
jgi:hypothetical protein